MYYIYISKGNKEVSILHKQQTNNKIKNH